MNIEVFFLLNNIKHVNGFVDFSFIQRLPWLLRGGWEKEAQGWACNSSDGETGQSRKLGEE